jgi:hypothetical protein
MISVSRVLVLMRFAKEFPFDTEGYLWFNRKS